MRPDVLNDWRRDWRRRVRQLRSDTRAVIHGRRVDLPGRHTFGTFHPFDGRQVALYPRAGVIDVDRAVASARSAFDRGDWAHATPADRQVVLDRWAALVQARAEELALLDTLEMGMPIGMSLRSLESAVCRLRETASLALRVLGEPMSGRGSLQTLGRRVPHGVMGVITDANLPCFTALVKVAAALGAGNSVVLKPSEGAGLSSLLLADLALQAGMPAGVLNASPGLGSETGEALAHHRHVDALSFSGSARVGRRLLRAAGDSNLKALVLDCAGKSPQIVFDDFGDAPALARALVAGFSGNSGQLHGAGTRLLVDKALLGRLVPALAAALTAAQAGLGDPLDPETVLGPLSSVARWTRVRTFVHDALLEGATSLAGDDGGEVAPRCCMRPLVLRAVHPQQAIVREAIPGPIAVLQGFESFDEAIALANDVPYWRPATVWSEDRARAERLGRRLRAGCRAPGAPHDAPDPSFGEGGGTAALLAATRAPHGSVCA